MAESSVASIPLSSAVQNNVVKQERELLAIALKRLNALRKEVQDKNGDDRSKSVPKNAWEFTPYLDIYFDYQDKSQLHFVKTSKIRAYFLFKPSSSTWVYLERNASGQDICYIVNRDKQGIPMIQKLN
ncbi:unnamed protein product [Bursaphelenchus okinawaensis]|uniref:Uncharacterized protein n=1 Tax=Bursaphelenchus okinawaensis TaxID=465554 RepID=A0A811LC87_9BILA|nr:unnamed protein product [Bursaphelenchus okinawaensis]CAG9120479.1 unnamed protein product [Bursaphelenchus okinawaensis]